MNKHDLIDWWCDVIGISAHGRRFLYNREEPTRLELGRWADHYD